MPASIIDLTACSACSNSTLTLFVALPWSRNASSVASGIVFTVFLPISESTYITSLYSGFLVPVLAQRGLWTIAPFSSRFLNCDDPKAFWNSW